jgi:hypothetical protein
VRGNQFMLDTLAKLRSRSVVVLPNDKTEDRNGRPMFDYDIEYLESQMRGADFERYMTRLDEEISIGLFTPILLMRTADVGSYNLGVGHMQMYLWMLNAMNDDRKQYLDNYLLRKMVNFNFSPKAPSAKIHYRKMGNTNTELIKELLVALVNQGKAKVDLKELGQMAGMKLSEVQETLAPPDEPNAPDEDTQDEPQGPDTGGATASITTSAARGMEARAVAKEIVARVRPQVEAAFRSNTFNSDLQINMGFKRKFEKALANMGESYPIVTANEFYGRMDNWINDVTGVGCASPENFMHMFEAVLNSEVDRLIDAS